jgi:hypothetical protein
MGILSGGPYRALIFGRTAAFGREPVLPSGTQSRSTPRGREAGAIPAQSRYGDRPLGGGSPVAGPRCFARTFERKVGRTVHPTG